MRGEKPLALCLIYSLSLRLSYPSGVKFQLPTEVVTVRVDFNVPIMAAFSSSSFFSLFCFRGLFLGRPKQITFPKYLFLEGFV